jgi:hypothetical protein
MKKIFILILVLSAITIIACHNDENNINLKDGIITGPDLRKCMCCGGFFLEVEDSTYRFFDFPANSGFNPSTDTFPIKVGVLFHLKDTLCLGDEIVIDQMQKK